VLIHILKRLPAPLMDGFDVRGFHAGQIYHVERRLGQYMVLAGYAEVLDETATDKSKRRRSQPSHHPKRRISP
jgi:hypothetical protein